MTTQVTQRDKLDALSKIGQGGQGVVYGAPNVKTKFAASMVYKEYKPRTRTDIDFTALAGMPALVEESPSYTQAERLISFAAWPCAIIEDTGTPTGFVMPAIPNEFFIPLTTAKGCGHRRQPVRRLLGLWKPHSRETGGGVTGPTPSPAGISALIDAVAALEASVIALQSGS